jgi:hypothetical protein
MSYLAFNAAPIKDNENTNGNTNDKKRNARNKTLKKYNSNGNGNGRVADMINQIHQSSLLNDDDNEMGDFNLPLPESVGNQRKAETEVKQQGQNTFVPHEDQSQGKWQGTSWHQAHNPPPQLQQQAQMQQQQINQQQQQSNNDDGDASISRDGFQNLSAHIPDNYLNKQIPYYNQMSVGGSAPNRDELLTKLNYMIHILEEQQDQKTGHVTEEVVLYSFLGIFIIFVIDSFARAGKYVR